MPKDSVLHRVRTALGRSVGQAPAPAPEVYLRPRAMLAAERRERFAVALEGLAGRVFQARSSQEACAYVDKLIDGREAVASNSPYLAECGIRAIRGVRSGITQREELKDACATAAVGITSADYALAETGTLVMIASPDEQRLISLLPPVHVAVVPAGRLLTGLDELFAAIPDPAAITSSMVMITGPSRTADIEQILVRGVHGPGEIHVVFVET